jgi:hypothetical protein
MGHFIQGDITTGLKPWEFYGSLANDVERKGSISIQDSNHLPAWGCTIAMEMGLGCVTTIR